MTDCGSVLLLALPPVTSNGQVFFAKSSIRPSSEIHEVIYMCASTNEPGVKLMVCFLFLLIFSSASLISFIVC